MTYKLHNYRHLKPTIESFLALRDGETPLQLISELALYTYCPIIVLGYLLIELGHGSVELDAKIDRFEKFYKDNVTKENV